MKVLVFGSKGWIGGQFMELLKKSPHQVIETKVRADNEKAVAELLNSTKPTHVISFIGRTHGPGYSTIDYLELPGKLKENVCDNLYAPLTLAFQCTSRGIHYTYLGTGCIFLADDPIASNYNEDALPDFFGSGYSTVKGFTDRLMHNFNSTVLNVRIRMPITPDLNPRNFITKITTYEKVCSIPNSMTVLPSLLPLLLKMMESGKTGTINLTNPGVISHNEILEMYKEIVDPNFTWKNFTVEEQNQILLSKRSNNKLDTTQLSTWYPEVLPIKEGVRQCLQKIAENKKDLENIQQIGKLQGCSIV
jgi:3,5-epimerase/4-reductase